MVNSVVGMCDENTVYMKKLAKYFMQKSNISMQIRSFSDWNQLIRYLKTRELDVLILGGSNFIRNWKYCKKPSFDQEFPSGTTRSLESRVRDGKVGVAEEISGSEGNRKLESRVRDGEVGGSEENLGFKNSWNFDEEFEQNLNFRVIKKHVRRIIWLRDEDFRKVEDAELGLGREEGEDEDVSLCLEMSRYQPPAQLLTIVEGWIKSDSYSDDFKKPMHMIREHSFYELDSEKTSEIDSKMDIIHQETRFYKGNRGGEWGNYRKQDIFQGGQWERSLEGENLQVVGVYSPVKRCGKTSLAVLFAEILARKGNSMMVCMDHYTEIFTDEDQNIAELIYYLSRDMQLGVQEEAADEEIAYEQFIKKWDAFFYIAASPFVESMMQIPAESFCRWIQILRNKKEYQYLILDLSDGIENLYQILDQCDVIFMPVLEDCISKGKVQQFEKQIKAMMGGELWKQLRYRIYQVKLPEAMEADGEENYYRELIWSDMGDFAEQLLEKYEV